MRVGRNHVRLLVAVCEKRLASSAQFTTVTNHRAKWKDDLLSNPLLELQPLLQVPISNLIPNLFEPDNQEIKDGGKFFQYPSGHGSVVHKPCIDPSLLPTMDVPEICFMGRSNVGKSSLISKLLPRNLDVQKHVKISSTPGFTTALKLVQVKNYFSLMDMPGYGYHMPTDFVDMVEGYLKDREQLVKTFLLVDGNVGFQSTDQTAIEMLEQFGKPFAIIFTKIDKSTQHKTLRHIMKFRELSEKMPGCFPQPFLVSSFHGYGLAFLQSYIAYITSNLTVKGL